MAINPLQLPQAPPINSLADFSPLERLVQSFQARQQEAQQNEQAYRDLGGQGQPQQSGNFLTDLGRKFGILPDAAPVQTAAVPPAGAPRFDNATDLMTNYGNAIAKIESGGRYDLLGPKTKTGDQAIGKYQVMGANVPSWTKEALGREMTPAEFRASPEAQEAVFKHRFGMYAQKYGPENAAKAWFAGERGMKNPNARDQLGTSVTSYAEQFRRNAGLPGGNPPVMAQGGAPDPNASPLDNMPWPHGNVGAPSSTDISAQTRTAPPLEEPAAPEARAVQNLTSGQPAAAAGLDRETLARMYRNPVTRSLAAAVLQKQMEPGKYSWQQVGTNLVRTNDRTGEQVITMRDTKPLIVGGSLATEDPSQPSGYRFDTPKSTAPIHVKPGESVIIPDGMGGQKTISGGSQAAIDVQNNTYKADVLDLKGRQRELMIANGRLPTSGDISPGDASRINKLQDVINASDSALTTLGEMEKLNERAFKGWGASFKAAAAANLIPKTEWGQRGLATLELNNEMTRSALNQLKAIFTGSQSAQELQVLRQVQGAIDNPDTINANIFKRARAVLELRQKQSEGQQEAIRTGEMYKPGGGVKTPTAGPSLNDFMAKARAANPGVPDSELNQYWTSKYGGK